MTEAILSCVHANLPALRAVLEDLAARGIGRVVSLGDIVGYGSKPRECLSLLKGADVAIMGNHEEAILFHGEDFNPRAKEALDATKEALDAPSLPLEESLGHWHALGSMQQVVQVGDVMYCHGSPRAPTREYVVPSDAGDAEKMNGIFDLITSICFIGHSHVAHVYRADGWHASPEDLSGELDLSEQGNQKLLINVGSVGQPRDGRPEASYVTFDGSVVRFHRVPYEA